MTCLLITSNFPPVIGGSAVVYHNLCKHSSGQIAVLAPWLDYRTGEELDGWQAFDRAASFPIYRTRLLRPAVKKKLRFHERLLDVVMRDLPLMIRVFLLIARIVIRDRIKIICIGDLVYLGWVTHLAKFLPSLKIVHYIHGEEITDELATGVHGAMKHWHLARADAVIAVSNFTREILSELDVIDPARITVIPNGVDCERFTPQAPPENLIRRYNLQGKKVLLSVGRLIERKGFDRTIEALPLLLKKFPDLVYLIVGAGPSEGRLRKLAEQYGVERNVVIAGSVSDTELADHYALAGVFVMPNRRLDNGDTEGFGLVFLEANACGKAVIGGNAGGVPDAIVSGETGFIVDGNSPIAISDAIHRILSDEHLSARLQAQALAHARRNTWRQRADEFQRVCAEITGPKRSPVVAAPAMPAIPVPAAANLTTVGRGGAPRLIITVDAEEEFEWGTFARSQTAVANIAAQGRVQNILDAYKAVPTYMMSYPVAEQPAGYEPLRELAADNRCIVGAQLHTWVTPPFEEKVSLSSTFANNLPDDLEFRKARALTDLIEQNLGRRPRIFRAGRYGFGGNSVEVLKKLGYSIDCSILPMFNYGHQGGGPRFAHPGVDPYWLTDDLLEIPITVGLVGSGARVFENIYSSFDGALAQRLHVRGILARLRIAERIRLSPEGITITEAKRLTRAMLARGTRLFLVTYHSPSLVPGNTPYVRTKDDLDRFLSWIAEYLDFFTSELGGTMTTPLSVHSQALAEKLTDHRQPSFEPALVA